MEVLLSNKHLACHFANLTMEKPNQQSMVRWRRDFSCQHMTLATSEFLRVFIPLTILNKANGAPKIIRGSNHVTDRTVKLLNTLNIRTTRKYPVSQSLFCIPGDVIFMHSKVWHYSEHNNPDNPQINLAMQVGIAQPAVSLRASQSKNEDLFRSWPTEP